MPLRCSSPDSHSGTFTVASRGTSALVAPASRPFATPTAPYLNVVGKRTSSASSSCGLSTFSIVAPTQPCLEASSAARVQTSLKLHSVSDACVVEW
eukprot:365418-Chlamydomonas_euryale.AAC.5